MVGDKKYNQDFLKTIPVTVLIKRHRWTFLNIISWYFPGTSGWSHFL